MVTDAQLAKVSHEDVVFDTTGHSRKPSASEAKAYQQRQAAAAAQGGGSGFEEGDNALFEDNAATAMFEQSANDARSKRIALDTGSSLMMGPETDIAAILEAVNKPHAHNKRGGCAHLKLKKDEEVDLNKLLPNIHFVLDNGYQLIMTANDYAYLDQDEGSGCALGFTPINLPDDIVPMYIFGQAFFRRYAVKFEYAKNRVGLMLSKGLTEGEILCGLSGSIVFMICIYFILSILPFSDLRPQKKLFCFNIFQVPKHQLAPSSTPPWP